jgi:phosphoglycolate phosphatase
MIRAVAVDLDDTLCLTEAVCFDLENEVLARLGRPPMSRAAHLATWGAPLLDAIRDRSPGVDLPGFAAEYRLVHHRYVAAGRLDVIPPENLAALDRLIAAGREVMLLTARTLAEMAHLLAPDHPLTGRLTAAYHAGNVRFGKPDPRAFDELLADAGLRPAECVYVGDGPGDARAATGAGLRFMACLESGTRDRAAFAGYRVDAFLARFADVADAVTRLDATG